MISRITVFGFSMVAGICITLGLLLTINLLANYRAPAKEKRPLLVVELTKWPTPGKQEKRESSPEPKQQPIPPQKEAKKIKPLSEPELAPVAKKIVKEKPLEPVESGPVEEIVEMVEDTVEPIPIPPTPSELTGMVEKSLPTPVPLFKLTQTPRFLHREVPVYPDVMRAQGISGVVKLEALIDKEGRVRKVSILKSAGKHFDEAAKRAILASSFYPAKVKHEPVAVLLRLPVKFSLL